MPGQLPMAEGRVTGGQRLLKIEFAVVGSKAKGLYNIPQLARTQPESSMSGDPPLPKRHRHAPIATVLQLTAQEPKATALDPTVQEFKGACQNRGCSLTWHAPNRGQYSHCNGTYVYQYR